ncbi:sulfatase, partial [Candidatus Hydrogenedentota bacterium]
CTPYRASLMTGKYPLTTGMFLNDLYLHHDHYSIADAYNDAGYDTGYIGKWHIDGHGRASFIPRERRQGFKFWKVLECTHNYNDSDYYGDENELLNWDGYDSIAQTREAQKYVKEHADGSPFALFLSWGPPHGPYQTAPEKYRQLFREEDIKLRSNVPAHREKRARVDLLGYYSHIAALDDCIGDLMKTLKECGIEENTIVVFTSDHGDMLHSHGKVNKQQPWDESIMVPFLLRYPTAHGSKGSETDIPINTPDIMPTLLALSGVDIPGEVEGVDLSGVVTGKGEPDIDAALIMCASPFGQWQRKNGGKEYRGIRTRRHTYVKDLDGPWLLFDNQEDPYQRDNLYDRSEHAKLQEKLEGILARKLKETKDEFLSGEAYVKKWGHRVGKSGTVSFAAKNPKKASKKKGGSSR